MNTITDGCLEFFNFGQRVKALRRKMNKETRQMCVWARFSEIVVKVCILMSRKNQKT